MIKAQVVFRSLQHRNYRLFFSGQSISLIGTWMQRIALPWLVYQMTGSEVLLGVVGFASQIPSFLLAPVAGVLIDRWSRYRVLVVTQIISMVQAGILAWLSLTGGAGDMAYHCPEPGTGLYQCIRHAGTAFFCH